MAEELGCIGRNGGNNENNENDGRREEKVNSNLPWASIMNHAFLHFDGLRESIE